MRGQSGDDEFEHALRNQVAVILGFAELLLIDLTPDDSRTHDVREIQRAGRTALELIDARRAGSGVSEACP